MRKKQFSHFSFQIFFRFWAKIFSDFWPNNVKNLSKLPSTCPEEHFLAWIFFLIFELLPIFCRNHWHGSQNSIYESRLKSAEKKTVFFVFFSEFFRFFIENFSDFRPKKFKNLWKLTSACPEEQLVALKIFKKFWTVLDFLQKVLAWFSKFYLRVQSKNCVGNSFLILLFRFFSDFERKIFQTFVRKTSRLCRNYLLRVRRHNLWLEFFFKFWTVLDFLQKVLAWFSKFYLRVQSKNCVRNSFLIFLFRFFSDFERKIFQTFVRKTSRLCQNYLLRVQRNNLWLEIFLEVLIRFGFSAETFGMVLKYLSTCPE